ncbi:MAG TPA: DUF4880 domain-containing protein, partial [Hydrogenophaga sp.]|uniref:DUF4880 domain-containing protein n=1 Tax=Hydrogenophaga sp. TaxID=1904254 RepID=UPI002BB0C308
MTAEDERIAQAAARWLVRLSADDPQERRDASAGFEAWKRADPRHAAVARGMEDFIGRARGLRGDGAPNPARAALDAVLDTPPPRRARSPGRRAAGLLVLA